MKKAHNAVLALARAMYGKSLTEKQYSDLLALNNSNEIASYLKTRTSFSAAFEGVGISNFTPEALCGVVNDYYLSRFQRFCRLQNSIGLSFYKYFAAEKEIEVILSCIMKILSGREDEYIPEVKSFHENNSRVDFWSLVKAESLEEASAVLKKTPYSKVFEQCLANKNASYFVFETAFDSKLSEIQYSIIKSSFKGKEKKAVYEAMCRRNDISFIAKLTRIIRFYSSQPDAKTALIPTKMTLFTEKELRAIIKAKDLSELDEALRKTPYKAIACLNECENIRAMLDDFLYKYYNKQIRFSVYPCVVMFSYMYLSQAETDNLVKIIQGNKYKVSAEEIAANLVGVKNISEKGR